MQSAITFMVEHASPNRRGLCGSFSIMASGLDEPFHRHTQSVEELRFGRSEAV